jgi:hypothetical protein
LADADVYSSLLLLLPRSLWSYIRPFFSVFCVSSQFIEPHIGPAIPTSADLRAATLGANWVYWPIAAPTLTRPRGGLSQSITSFSCFSLGWGLLLALAHADTRYKEPRFTVPFDGCKEPPMISPMWPGTCRF